MQANCTGNFLCFFEGEIIPGGGKPLKQSRTYVRFLFTLSLFENKFQLLRSKIKQLDSGLFVTPLA